MTAENIRSPWGGQEGRGWGGTARHFLLGLYLYSLDKDRELAQVSVCVWVGEREIVCLKETDWREFSKFNLVDLREAFQRR